jgi:hypothetical protein
MRTKEGQEGGKCLVMSSACGNGYPFLLKNLDTSLEKHTVKKGIVFPVPSRDVTNQTP